MEIRNDTRATTDGDEKVGFHNYVRVIIRGHIVRDDGEKNRKNQREAKPPSHQHREVSLATSKICIG